MGLRSQASHPCSLIKQQKGWLTNNEIQNVSTTGTYRIYALEKTLPGQTQSLIIDLPNDLDIQPNDPTIFSKLYLEYRGLTGFDSRVNRNVTLSDGSNYSIQEPHGLLIIGADCETNTDYCVPVVLDTHPQPLGGVGVNYLPHEASDAQLNLGETYFVGNNTISIEVVNILEEEYIDVHIDFSALSVAENTAINEVNVYPNPASDIISVDGKLRNSSIEEICIYDLHGRKIKTFTHDDFDSSLPQINLNIKDIISGTYLIQIKGLKNSITKKIMISK
jgi:hypothetical protein